MANFDNGTENVKGNDDLEKLSPETQELIEYIKKTSYLPGQELAIFLAKNTGRKVHFDELFTKFQINNADLIQALKHLRYMSTLRDWPLVITFDCRVKTAQFCARAKNEKEGDGKNNKTEYKVRKGENGETAVFVNEDFSKALEDLDDDQRTIIKELAKTPSHRVSFDKLMEICGMENRNEFYKLIHSISGFGKNSSSGFYLNINDYRRVCTLIRINKQKRKQYSAGKQGAKSEKFLVVPEHEEDDLRPEGKEYEDWISLFKPQDKPDARDVLREDIQHVLRKIGINNQVQLAEALAMIEHIESETTAERMTRRQELKIALREIADIKTTCTFDNYGYFVVLSRADGWEKIVVRKRKNHKKPKAF